MQTQGFESNGFLSELQSAVDTYRSKGFVSMHSHETRSLAKSFLLDLFGCLEALAADLKVGISRPLRHRPTICFDYNELVCGVNFILPDDSTIEVLHTSRMEKALKQLSITSVVLAMSPVAAASTMVLGGKQHIEQVAKFISPWDS